MAKKPTSKNSKMMMADKAMKKEMGHSIAEHKKMMDRDEKMPPKKTPPKGMMKKGKK